MCRPRTNAAPRLIAAAVAGVALAAALGGCSDIYFDRRDTVSLGAGDDIAANNALQTIDPWPAQSGNPNLAFNGQRMQAAIERYRQGKVTDAVDAEAAVSSSQTQNVTQVSVGAGAASPTGTTSTSSGSSSTTTTTNSGQ